MADVLLKEQKLAAARRKLKKYQKRKDGNNKISKSGESSPCLEGNHTTEISSSRSSSVTDISETGLNNVEKAENETNSINLQNSPLEILNNHQFANGLPEPNSSINSYQVPYSTPNANDTTTTTTTPATLAGVGNSKPIQNNIPYTESIKNGSENTSNLVNKYDSNENEGSLCSETNASMTTVVHVKNNLMQNPQDTSLRSTTESLRQLSLQMSGLVNDAEIHEPSKQDLAIMELEKRNNELASYLETEKQKSMEQNYMIEEMKRTIAGQNVQIQGLQNINVTENGTEVNGLREQLQVHIQTIGILVAEKSELQTSLSHVRYALEQKNGEATELQGRLEASRGHVTGLEASNREMKIQLSAATDSKESDSQQLLHLQANYSKLSKLCDEMRASTAELTERLAVRTEENQKLSDQLADVRRKYELAQVHVEQLRDETTEDLRKQVKELANDLSASENKLHLASAALEQAQKEKNQMEVEYQSYTTELATELADLKNQLTQETKKFEYLNVIKTELEANLKSTELHSQVIESLEQTKRERDQVTEALSQIKGAKEQLERNCSSLSRDNGQLSQLLAEQSAKLDLLEAAADRSSTHQVDTSQLLQAMQSDKIAAARALTQNKQLKEQLEELQNGFIMMSNKKLELTEKLEREMHHKKSLCKEISQLGEELSSHKEIVVSKQREIDKGKKGKSVTFKLDHSPIRRGHTQRDHDHDHHSHDHSEDGCPEEHVKCVEENVSGAPATENESSNQDDGSLRVERAEEAIEKAAEKEETESQQNIPRQNGEEVEEPSHEVSVRVAHEALEKRFLKCMQDLAAVSDEKQNLEHVVQQLQLETETIGDYITIYIFQRGVLKQQMIDLKFELELMKTDKQEMAGKLTKLLQLVESLASGKNPLSHGFLEGINSILNSSAGAENDGERPEEAEPPDSESRTEITEDGVVNMEIVSHPQNPHENEKSSKTVKQIIDLISEMETATQLDVSALHKFHPCQHCSGKLITI